MKPSNCDARHQHLRDGAQGVDREAAIGPARAACWSACWKLFFFSTPGAAARRDKKKRYPSSSAPPRRPPRPHPSLLFSNPPLSSPPQLKTTALRRRHPALHGRRVRHPCRDHRPQGDQDEDDLPFQQGGRRRVSRRSFFRVSFLFFFLFPFPRSISAAEKT